MSHSVECVAFTDGTTERYEGRRNATMATIEVRPPITVGEGFTDTVLGQEKNGIHMEHIFSGNDAKSFTSFVVEAALYDPGTHRQMIERVGERIGQLVNGEVAASVLAAQNPFPRPR